MIAREELAKLVPMILEAAEEWATKDHCTCGASKDPECYYHQDDETQELMRLADIEWSVWRQICI